MTTDDLDRILASEEPLLPSSGFARVVMERVRESASAPPPLAFPWRGFVIRLSFLSALAVVCGWIVATSPAAGALRAALASALAVFEDARVPLALSAISLSLVGTYLLVRLTLSFAGARR
jgi:hypothetical protein